MDEKYFIIAIGGTGMRCLESFVHLCAMGMFDGKEFDVLTLDTDSSNGNKDRVETLIEQYNAVKRDGTEEGGVNTETFFSAKINLYTFITEYTNDNRAQYSLLSKKGFANISDNDRIDDQDLSDLFFDKNVQEFDLARGYRAQTHLGSMLMYYGIVEAMRAVSENKENANQVQKNLFKFIQLLAAAPHSRVFVFGSVFGGTGASSIPIIPTALHEASKLSGGNTVDLDHVKFGSTLLTQYFKFTPPDKSETKDEKVIANSDYFAINSQAALMFYQDDPTVKKYYKRLYHVGWPDAPKDVASGPLQTGGKDQKNPCHVVELMCACAAYDFFNLDDTELSNANAEYFYRSVEEKDGHFIFGGKSFIDGTGGDKLANKLGIFLSFAHLVLSTSGAAFDGTHGSGTKALIDLVVGYGKDNSIYSKLTDVQAVDIDKYLKSFAYDYDKKKEELIPGWIYQIHDSVGSGSFFFKESAFEKDPRRLCDVDPGDLFIDDKYNWIPTKRRSKNNSYEEWSKTMTDRGILPKEDSQHVKSLKEKFLAHMYLALARLQHYNK